MTLKGNSKGALAIKFLITAVVVFVLFYIEENYHAASFGDKLKVYGTCYHYILAYGIIWYGLTLIGRFFRKFFKFSSGNYDDRI